MSLLKFPFHIELPHFESDLTDLLFELEKLREKILTGSTPSIFFLQLKNIFHLLESIGSARIEGNHTTIFEYIELQNSFKSSTDEEIIEITNVENALRFIEKNIFTSKIDRAFISELHKIAVSGLKKEGSKNPGAYRKGDIKIKGSKHTPPFHTEVQDYMEKFFEFINQENAPKLDLLKIATAHHAFVWIHPFDNGNGRVVRLLTYAMLMQKGFSAQSGLRILNPTAVFCSDRNRYYDYLSEADSASSNGVLKWYQYVLGGLKEEIEKIERLCNYNYVKTQLLMPSVTYLFKQNAINKEEEKILLEACKTVPFQNSDLTKIIKGKHAADLSRKIKKLKEKKLISSYKEAQRKYILNFSEGSLLRSIIYMLKEEGFIPEHEIL